VISRLCLLLAASIPLAAQSQPWFFIQMSDPQFGMYSTNQGFEQETVNFEFAIASANRLKPAFVVVTGDLVNKAGDAAQIAEYKRIAAKLDRSIPLYSVPGNHDEGNEPTAESLAAYREKFGPGYYTFRSHDMAGFVLDGNLLKAPQHVPDEARKQEKWLRQELERAKREGVRQLVVFLHQPLFLEEPQEPEQYFNLPLDTRRRYLELFHEYGVEHVYAGHYHRNAYGRDGSLEVVTSGPVSRPLGNDPSGFRIVTVKDGNLDSHYYGLGYVPPAVDLQSQPVRRTTLRELGVAVGILPAGPLNAITDVAGVAVGHKTVVSGDDVRTGVTAVLPHGGNVFQQKVTGAVFIGNAFGKLAGSTQVDELGEIETPILLTSTLSVPRVADAVLDYMLALPGNERVQSVNPLVGETNDGYLNDIRGRHVGREDVLAAIQDAKGGLVVQGAVGAGTGTVAFGFKGGIGTSSRKLPARFGGYTVGVLVQTNFGGILTIAGAPVGRELGRYYLRGELDSGPDKGRGSCMIVVATDAPVDARNLKRLAARTMLGLGRTGSSGSNGSGDYAIAFSTSRSKDVLSNDAMSPLFLAAIEATEEAVYNSLFMASTMTARSHTVEALPIDRTMEILRKYGVAVKQP
jgi:D-aminopeptidase